MFKTIWFVKVLISSSSKFLLKESEKDVYQCVGACTCGHTFYVL